MRLIPRETKFFELFDELSACLTEGAKLLRSILYNPQDLGLKVEQMQAIEHRGDSHPRNHHQAESIFHHSL